MKFSALDVIGQERRILANRKEYEHKGVWNRVVNMFFYPRNPKHYLSFFIPQYLYIRSVSFCEDIEDEIEEAFTPGDLASVLYTDFLEYVKRTNDMHMVHSRLKARDLAPIPIRPYQTDETYQGVITEEVRGFETVSARLDHRAALKGEFLLHDMLEIYRDHTFTLENILEITYCDFIDDYRKGLIKNPIQKITQYL